MNLAEKLKRFETGLELFLHRVKADPNLLAAVLVGSLSKETIWRREAISLWIIEKDGVTKRLRADGEDPRIFRTLVEEGVNLHVELIPRARFKRMVEGRRAQRFDTVTSRAASWFTAKTRRWRNGSRKRIHWHCATRNVSCASS